MLSIFNKINFKNVWTNKPGYNHLMWDIDVDAYV